MVPERVSTRGRPRTGSPLVDCRYRRCGCSTPRGGRTDVAPDRSRSVVPGSPHAQGLSPGLRAPICEPRLGDSLLVLYRYACHDCSPSGEAGGVHRLGSDDEVGPQVPADPPGGPCAGSPPSPSRRGAGTTRDAGGQRHDELARRLLRCWFRCTAPWGSQVFLRGVGWWGRRRGLEGCAACQDGRGGLGELIPATDGRPPAAVIASEGPALWTDMQIVITRSGARARPVRRRVWRFTACPFCGGTPDSDRARA